MKEPENTAAAAAEAIAAASDNIPAAERTAEDRIRDLEAEVADLKERLLRQLAETENLRKRAEREKQEAARYSVGPFARDMVPVADNLARALQAIPETARSDDMIRTLMSGVEMTERELLAALERHGVKRISPLGEPFNANFHQAVAEQPSADMKPGHVLAVIQSGYRIDDRLIRPAMVVIARAAEAAGAPAEAPIEGAAAGAVIDRTV